MPPAKQRAGLYGAGAFGRFLLHSLRQSEDLEIIAIANRTYERGVTAAAEFGITTVHRSFDSLLAQRDIEVVIIATPPADHGPAVLQALAANKHVFVEKPLAIDMATAERIRQEAASRHLRVGIDYPMPYTPLVKALTLFRSSRLAGPLVRISVENLASCKGLDDGHWFWKPEISGGIFVEHGVHFFDWCGALAGAPIAVSALNVVDGRREDRVFASVTHADGVIASYLHAFITTPPNERTTAVVSFESLDVTLQGWIPTVMRLSGPASGVATTALRRMLDRSVESVPSADAGFIFDAGPKQTAYETGVRAAVGDFVQGVREPKHVPLNDLARALSSLRVALAARDAALNGATQRLADPSTVAVQS